MDIRARVTSRPGEHDVELSTNGSSHSLLIDPQESGQGSSVNGGELLALAVATCFCNDVYREARSRAIQVHSLQVDVVALFGGIGEPARQIRYRVLISAGASEEVLHELVAQTDRIAEIHNTLRLGMPVELESITVDAPMPPGLNAEWHRAHRMPPKATLEQRLEWHVEHQKHCACRDMPATIRAALARRGGNVTPQNRA